MKTFDEVVTLILNNYVESVEPDRIMHGAMRGLAEGLDADSAWLTPEETGVGAAEDRGPEGRDRRRADAVSTGCGVIAARDGSPAGEGRPQDRRLHPR